MRLMAMASALLLGLTCSTAYAGGGCGVSSFGVQTFAVPTQQFVVPQTVVAPQFVQSVGVQSFVQPAFVRPVAFRNFGVRVRAPFVNVGVGSFGVRRFGAVPLSVNRFGGVGVAPVNPAAFRIGFPFFGPRAAARRFNRAGFRIGAVGF